MILFGRKWRWTVDTITSDDVDMSFKIERSLSQSSHNKCALKLYNLKQDNRTAIHAAAGRMVRIEAGYTDATWILFQGDVRRADSVIDPPATWHTDVTAGDGQFSIQTARVSFSLGPGSTLQNAIQQLASAMGVGTGNAAQAFQSATLDQLTTASFQEGAVFHGPAVGHLNALARTAGLSWSIQDGVLQFIPRGGFLQRAAVLVSQDTGMVGSPELGRHNLVKVKSLLQPELVPGQRIQLQSAQHNGVFRIEKAEYEGDTMAQPWYVTMETRAVA